ncbi:hypothetical protein GQ457_03G032400 [Hibiscus cannabinus]
MDVVEDDNFYAIFAKLGASSRKSSPTEVKRTSRTSDRCPYMSKKTSIDGDRSNGVKHLTLGISFRFSLASQHLGV